MAEHYTRGTESVTRWCRKCEAHTQFNVEGKRATYCIPCFERQKAAAEFRASLGKPGLDTTAEPAKTATIHVRISCPATGTVVWTCDCNESRTCLGGHRDRERGAFHGQPGPRETPLMEANRTAASHVVAVHPMCNLEWTFLKPEGDAP